MRQVLVASAVIGLLAGCAKSSDLEELTGAVQTLRMERMMEDMYPNGIVMLRPADDGYSVAKYDLGTLLVRIERIDSYADGSRVTLLLGNPLSVGVDGLNATADWGSTDEKGNMKSAGQRTKKIGISERLVPGAWTRVPLTLEGVPPAALGFIRLTEIDHRSVSLRHPFDERAAQAAAEAAAAAADAAAAAVE
jgi:hypothetical protein